MYQKYENKKRRNNPDSKNKNQNWSEFQRKDLVFSSETGNVNTSLHFCSFLYFRSPYFYPNILFGNNASNATGWWERFNEFLVLDGI